MELTITCSGRQKWQFVLTDRIRPVGLHAKISVQRAKRCRLKAMEKRFAGEPRYIELAYIEKIHSRSLFSVTHQSNLLACHSSASSSVLFDIPGVRNNNLVYRLHGGLKYVKAGCRAQQRSLLLDGSPAIIGQLLFVWP